VRNHTAGRCRHGCSRQYIGARDVGLAVSAQFIEHAARERSSQPSLGFGETGIDRQYDRRFR